MGVGWMTLASDPSTSLHLNYARCLLLVTCRTDGRLSCCSTSDLSPSGLPPLWQLNLCRKTGLPSMHSSDGAIPHLALLSPVLGSLVTLVSGSTCTVLLASKRSVQELLSMYM